MKWTRNKVEIKEPIIDYLQKLFDELLESGKQLSVSIGTDSQRAGKGVYKFATVILIRMKEDLGDGVSVGRGGMLISATYFKDFKGKGVGKIKDKDIVNERMVYEVSKSVEVAYELATLLDVYEIPLEIHADINPNPKFESNKALQQAIGYILGMGYEFKVKPDAWTASYAADHKC
jgi:uncharacterized protein